MSVPTSQSASINRKAWNYFLQQIDAQVEGDFLSLAAKYEAVTGQPFQVCRSPQVLFSMLQQALMSQNKQLLKSTVELIALLPLKLQAEFSVYSRHHPHGNVGKHHDKNHKKKSLATKPLSTKLWDILHFNRVA
jgi:hypothetical protein